MLMSSLTTLTSCSKEANDNAAIQLWTYDYKITRYQSDVSYFENVKALFRNIMAFCDENKIPLEVVMYDASTMSYEDYILKRNIAAAKGNMIIIEDASNLWDLSENHADYTKLENYNQLLDAYKDRFCIPLGISNYTITINNSILDFYGIKLDKSLITYEDYLELKQTMKDKGAKFQVNNFEYSEKIRYYMDKYNLSYINDTKEITGNEDKFKADLKSLIVDFCNDFIKYHDSKFDVAVLENDNQLNVYDENSGLNMFYQLESNIIPALSLTEYDSLSGNFEIIDNNNVSAVYPIVGLSPSFYMHNKITNEKIYDVANFIISEESYKTISGKYNIYSPVFKGELTKETLKLDDNYDYIGIYKTAADSGDIRSKTILKFIDESLEMLIKNDDYSKHIADYYLSNQDDSRKIYNFISDRIIKLSEDNFEYKNEDLEKEIDEFIKNFIVHKK